MENLSIKDRFILLANDKKLVSSKGYIYQIKDNKIYCGDMLLSSITNLIDPDIIITESIELHDWDWAKEQINMKNKVRWHKWGENKYLWSPNNDIIINENGDRTAGLDLLKYFSEKGWVLYEG